MKEGYNLKRKIFKYTMIGVFLFLTFLGIEKVNAKKAEKDRILLG